MSSVALLGRCPLRPISTVYCAILGTRPQIRGARGRGACHSARALLSPDAVFSAATVAVMPLYTLMVGFPRASITKRILQPGHFYTAAAALYSILLIAWWPAGIGQLCREAFQGCSPLPDVHVLARAFTNAHVTALAWVHLLLLDIVQARILVTVAAEAARPGVASVPSSEQQGLVITALRESFHSRIKEETLEAEQEQRIESRAAKRHQKRMVQSEDSVSGIMTASDRHAEHSVLACREVWLDGLKHGVATGHSIVLCFMFGPLGILSHMLTKRAFPARQNASQASSAQGVA